MMPSITLVGRPFAPIGVGEDIRSTFRALRAAGLECRVLDAYDQDPPDEGLAAEIGTALTGRLAPGIRIFHLNGDEVERALDRLGSPPLGDGRNVIYPAWELPRYPAEWARRLDRFDEIWAQSRFTCDSLSGAVSRPVHHLPLASEAYLTSFLGRRHFGIPESAYVFLFLFDFKSFIERKNPFAGIESFARLLRQRPYADVRFLMKLSNSQEKPDDFARFQQAIEPYRNYILTIDKTLSDNETKNLIRCCDCFVSMHRSEGYGRGLSEAMFLGKPVIATGYSGNLDFTTPETALVLDHRLIPVAAGAYPFGEGQVWADPSIDQAAAFMVSLLDSPQRGRRLGEEASRHIRKNFSYLACGLRYRDRIESLLDETGAGFPEQ